MINFRDLKEVTPGKKSQPTLANSAFTQKSKAISFRNLGNESPGDSKDESSHKKMEPKPSVSEKDRSSLYEEAHVYLNQVLIAVRQQKSFNLDWGLQIMQEIVKFQSTEDALFLEAIHSEKLYNYVVRHSVNVAIFSTIMAKNLGYDYEQLIEIGMVGLLHDVGIGLIPESIIYKEGRLNDKEFEIMKERCKYGYKILQRFQDNHPYLSECTLQVYERVDGSGYPKGLKGEEVHEYAQIVGLAAVYEALIHSRPQREKFLHFVAAKEIIKTGKKSFKTEHLKALLNIFSVFPLHSHVKLNSGAIGRVIAIYPDQLMRPKLQILFDSQGRKVLTERIIDLPENPLLYIIDAMAEEDLSEVAQKHDQMSASPGSMKSREIVIASAGKDVAGSQKAAPVRRVTQEADLPDSAFKFGTSRWVFGIGVLICTIVVASWFFWGKSTQDDLGTKSAPPNLQKVVKTYDIEKGAQEGSVNTKTVSSQVASIDEPAADAEASRKMDEMRRNLMDEPELVMSKGIIEGSTDDLKKAPMGPDVTDQTAPEIGAPKSSVIATVDSEAMMGPVQGTELESDTTQSGVEDVPSKAVVEALDITGGNTPPLMDEVPDMMVSVTYEKTAVPEVGKETARSLPPELKRGILEPNYPFSIKLTYFKTSEEAENSLNGYREKGMNPFWVKVNLGSEGIWHRVFTGYFENREKAAEYIEEYRLQGTPVKHTRFTTLTGVYTSKSEADQAIEALHEKGLSAHSIERSSGQITVHVGAFYTRKGAEEQSTDLTEANIGHHIVER